MPTNRTALRRPRRGRLSADQEMSLWLGEAAHRPPAFRDDAERRELWFRHRDRLLALFGHHGRRPIAWWEFEAPIPWPSYDNQEAALFEVGLLSDAERNALLAEWRRQFERAQEPGFVHCIGHLRPSDTFASWLKGAAAKRAHYAWAGIPRSLVREWTAARRRRDKAAAA